MKVKDMVKKLQSFDQEAEMVMADEDIIPFEEHREHPNVDQCIAVVRGERSGINISSYETHEPTFIRLGKQRI